MKVAGERESPLSLAERFHRISKAPLLIGGDPSDPLMIGDHSTGFIGHYDIPEFGYPLVIPAMRG